MEQGKGKWRVQDDVVMGGRSNSQLKMNEDSRATFSGKVSLKIMVVFALFIKLPKRTRM